MIDEDTIAFEGHHKREWSQKQEGSRQSAAGSSHWKIAVGVGTALGFGM